jgi:hypothetical protein
MKIRTPQQYRAAVEEAQRLADASEGTAQFRRPQELMAAMHDYELRYVADPNWRPGRPTASI